MRASIRRIIEMGNRVLEFSRAHPDPSAGYAAELSRLESALLEAEQLAARQRDGISAVRTATTQKRSIRRKIRRTQWVHFARVAEAAAAELPEIAQKFRLVKEAVPYLAFRTAARSLKAEAEGHRELLVKYGLLESSIESLAQSLAQFEQAVEQGNAGRRTHVGASAELETLAEELVQVVRLMDGANRYRFAEDSDALAAWESAINTFAPSRTAGKPTSREAQPGGELKPAA